MSLIELPGGVGIHPGQWRLARIEVVNWGTFHGHTAIDVARKGHLFTGASGSGKSSLLDAIATVLTPGRWLRFNAAAQESTARNDDRSLISYVRGAWSKQADAELDRAVSSYLRAGATWSGILLRYENLVDAPVTLARIFHIRGGSVERAELEDLAFADRGEIDLLEFQPHVASGIDARRIKAAWPSAVTTTNGSHKAYFSRVTRLLGIGSAGSSGGTENALHLLHKTQSAKNLGSLDHLFRAFMLDEPSTFARAANAVEQFGELNEAHRLVVEAREQLEALAALEPSILEYESAVVTASSAERLSALIDVFEQRVLIAITAGDLAETRSLFAHAEDDAQRRARSAAEAREMARLAALRSNELGGAEAHRARERVDAARQLALEVESRWQRFVEELAAVGLAAPQNAHEFAELQDAARRELDESSRTDLAVLHEHEENRAYFDAKREVEKIDRELAELKQRKSNLPAPLLVARRWLADELGVDETVLPFAGELIEVKPEFAEWTGAIERVLHPLAATMLVRDDHLARVRRLADAKHFGTRLRFEAVPAIADSPRPARSPRSLLSRVAVGNGPFADWLRWRLAEQFDYACVDHVDELDEVERGVTLAGQLKASARRYEKNDAVRVDDRRHWILGADNAEKIDTLLEQRRDAEARLRTADGRLKQVQASREAELKRRSQLERLCDQLWSEIDRAAGIETVRARQAQLEAVTSGNTELSDAVALEQEAKQRADAAELADREADAERRRLAGLLSELEVSLARLNEQRESTQIDERDSAELDRRYRALQRRLDRSSVPTVGRKVLAELNAEARAARASAESARSAFEHGAYAFRSRWPVPAADLTTTIDDRAGFRAVRTEIEARGLPAHEQRFLRLLREKSQELIGHLLADIRDAPKHVRERIDPVNESLSHSLFDRDRFLEIRVKEQRAPEVQRFLDELRSVVEGSWDDVAFEIAEARFSTLAEVMRRLGSSTSEDLLWKQRCLDTREHVTFQAREIDRGRRIVNVHDSSAGLSGGQRQKLVIFCLAAALRYQLTSDEDAPPTYATIVLDEAFDKADSSYTRMAMDVFEAFGFHMLLATPQKLLSTIEPYVGAVTSISNESRKRSTVANVAFEPIDGADERDSGETTPAGGRRGLMPSMLTVKDARSRAAKRVARDLRDWAIGGGNDAVFDLPLHPPTERDALAGQTAAVAWARSWDSVDGVEWGIRRWPSLGTQRVPTRLVLRGAERICAFTGRAELLDWQTLCARTTTVVARFGSAPTVTAALRSVGRTILDLDEDDFARLCSVLAWLSEHPESGHRIRQLPVRGVDTKWVGRHRGLVGTLHAAISGRDSLGLLATPELIRLRFLDPALRLAGLIDVSAPSSELSLLAIRPQVILVVENLETLLAMPELTGTVAVHGAGFGAGQRLAALKWIADTRLVYWGDLDSHGFAILDQLRSRLPHAESLLMDETTLREHRDLWGADPKPTRAVLERLTPAESATLELLRTENHARLEQERIPWAYVQDRLRSVFDGA